MSNILNKKSFLLFLLLFGSTIQFGDYIGNRYFVPLLSLFSVIIFLPGVKSLKKIKKHTLKLTLGTILYIESTNKISSSIIIN